MSAVKVLRGKLGERSIVLTESPYYPTFPEEARKLGGRWDAASKRWYFDARDEADVRKLLLETYGTDGNTPKTVDVELDVEIFCQRDHGGWVVDGEYWMFGRQLAKRWDRDSKVSLGDGVRVLRGGFPSSGGSRKSPRLSAEENTVLLVRDVPTSLVHSNEYIRPRGDSAVPSAFRDAFVEKGDS